MMSGRRRRAVSADSAAEMEPARAGWAPIRKTLSSVKFSGFGASDVLPAWGCQCPQMPEKS